MIKRSKNIRRSFCIAITWCFSLFVKIVKEKKCYQIHAMNLLSFLILESVSMIIVLICCKNMTIIFSKSVSHFLFDQIVSYCLGKKTSQEILYTAILDYLLRYIRSQSGRKLNPGATHVYSCDLNLRTNCFSIVSFRLYTWETCHSRHDIGKVWQTWGYKFASIHHFNSDIAMLYIDQTPVIIGI